MPLVAKFANPKSGRRGHAERRYYGSRFVREDGYIIVVVHREQNFRPISSLRDFSAHEEGDMAGGICQSDCDLRFAV